MNHPAKSPRPLPEKLMVKLNVKFKGALVTVLFTFLNRDETKKNCYQNKNFQSKRKRSQ